MYEIEFMYTQPQFGMYKFEAGATEFLWLSWFFIFSERSLLENKNLVVSWILSFSDTYSHSFCTQEKYEMQFLLKVLISFLKKNLEKEERNLKFNLLVMLIPIQKKKFLKNIYGVICLVNVLIARWIFCATVF